MGAILKLSQQNSEFSKKFKFWFFQVKDNPSMSTFSQRILLRLGHPLFILVPGRNYENWARIFDKFHQWLLGKTQILWEIHMFLIRRNPILMRCCAACVNTLTSLVWVTKTVALVLDFDVLTDSLHMIAGENPNTLRDTHVSDQTQPHSHEVLRRLCKYINCCSGLGFRRFNRFASPLVSTFSLAKRFYVQLYDVRQHHYFWIGSTVTDYWWRNRKDINNRKVTSTTPQSTAKF